MTFRPVVLLLAVCGAALLGCGRGGDPTPPDGPPDGPPDAPHPAGPTPAAPWFEDVTDRAGIRFDHFDSTTPRLTIPESMGSGLGWVDYDSDGWPDLFCVQDGPLPPAPGDPTKTHKLFRNNGDGTFTDVTGQVGLNRSGYGMGCAVGDYDNDGHDDLLVTYLGGLSLFHNEPDPAAPGGRRFAEVTTKAGLSDPHWATSCGWADIDADGFLDLYVCNYVEVDLAHYTTCHHPQFKKPHICPPTAFPVVAHKLFRNNGDGTFADISAPSGIAGSPAAGLAVALLDLDADGKPDIYVANDLGRACLFRNLGGGRFADRGMVSGAGADRYGRFMSGMGIGVGDLDGTGRPSLVVTNFQNEPTEVFLNAGRLTFREWSHPSGVGPATLKTLGFGIDLFDPDLDGNLDIAQANGHIYKNAAEVLGIPQEQPAQLLLGDGHGRFREVSAAAGRYFQERHLGRGLAVADFDNDGRPDLAVSHNGGPVKLLRNATNTQNHWLQLRLAGDGKRSNRNAVGARVEVEAGGRKRVRWVHGGGSYLSASDRRVHVGLGPAAASAKVTVTWPSGVRQEFGELAAGRGWRLTEGKDPR